jgi:hypothetical protein
MLTTIVVVETMLLVLLSFLMVGMLRSHAEILRRLPASEDEDEAGSSASPIHVERSANGHGTGTGRIHGASEPAGGIPDHLPTPRPEVTPAHDIAGRTLDGASVVLSVTGAENTLVAFLSSGCLTCRTFWDGLQPSARRPLPSDPRVIVVTKDTQMESPARLRELASPDVPVVLSSAAWEAYGIPMSPYFLYVDGPSGEVRSEGAASSWEQVSSLLADAIDDEGHLRAEAASGSGG